MLPEVTWFGSATNPTHGVLRSGMEAFAGTKEPPVKKAQTCAFPACRSIKLKVCIMAHPN
ncbi:MAG: hypothetical protein DMG70_19420 [Acidobacteria bacterium]|nr:MAG: hypothetical protein DMG70_19420 [Acidobacteriota bacterium]PYY09279.1 MAG: hypothetical protein DMG69_10795 [Acidobacteriota bacterium]